MARAAVRQHEIAVRAALGASRWRITSQLLTESVLLAILGGTLGVVLAYGGVQMLARMSEATLPRVQEVRLDAAVLCFSLVVPVVTGLLFGLVPALQSAKPDLNVTLKEGGRGSSFGARHWLRGALVVSEVALSLVLLVGGGLLMHSLIRLRNVPTGFDPHWAVAMDVELPERKYPNGQRRAQALHALFQSIEALPGVEVADTATTLVLGGGSLANQVKVEGRVNQPEGGYDCSYDRVAGKHFQAMGIPVLKGRAFVEGDNSTNAVRTAILNEALAMKIFPSEEPLGRRVRFWDEVWEIVGIVGDVRHDGLNVQASERIYVPQAFGPWVGALIVRTRTDPSALISPIRKAILAVDPEQPVSNIRTLEQVLANSVAARRLLLTLVGIFATTALVLAGIGLYGVMAHAVTQRTQEIGIRMALGAQRTDVLKLIVKNGIMLTLVGVAVGLAGALALARVIKNQLYEVGPTDPVAFAGVSLLLLAVASLACWLPARRAAKVDPMEALRYE